MYFSIALLCILSTAFVKADLGIAQDDNDVPSIDEQVAPLGTDNVFCLFTYGNWVMPASMLQDVPSAVYAGVSRLPGHRLDFKYYSEDLQGSIPTIVPDYGYEVWGSLYLIPVQDLDTVLLKGGLIDNKKIFAFVQIIAEAYSNGKIIDVKCNAFQQNPIPDKLIYGLPLPPDQRPSQQILDMLTEAYTDGGLPQQYIDEVSQIPTRDQDDLQTNLVSKTQTQQQPVPVVAPGSVAPAQATVQPANNQQ